MSSPTRIRTPLVQRWHRFRQQVLPVVFFVACFGVTLWMWERQARTGNVVGQIHAVRVDVTAPGTGMLASQSPTPEDPEGEKSWELFDAVQEGEEIARLDDQLLRAELKSANAEMARLQQELEATSEALLYEHASEAHDLQVTREQERVQRLLSAERLRLDVLDRRTRSFEDQLELERLDTLIGQLSTRLDRLRQQDIAVSDYDLQDLRAQRKVVAKRYEENRKGLEEALKQYKAVEARTREIFADAPVPPAVETLLAPLKQAITVQAANVDALQTRLESLIIRAPTGGTITAVHSRPGQAVQTGAPVVTIASNRSGDFIVSYIRQEQRLYPTEGMRVQLRTRGPGAQTVESVVEDVGTQYETIPPSHQSDPAVLEWGLPVRIRLPVELRARPGEKIDIVFPPRQQQAS